VHIVRGHVERQGKDPHRAVRIAVPIPPLQSGTPQEEVSTARLDAHVGPGVSGNLEDDRQGSAVVTHIYGRSEPCRLGDGG